LRKIFILFFVILVLSSCGKGQKKLNIAVIGRMDNSYWNTVKIGAERAGKTLDVSVSCVAPSKDDPAWQIKKIEEFIANKVSGIAFAASDPKSIAPIITKAMNVGIPCIALDTNVAKSRHLYIGTGNYYVGQEAGQQMASILDNNGKVAIIGDSTENSDLLQRVIGFRDVLSEYISLETIATIIEKDAPIQASEVEMLLDSIPDIDGLFCVSDLSGISAAEALKKINKVGHVKLVCIGESERVMSMVKDGIIQVAIARKPYRIGYLGVLALYNMAKVGVNYALMIMPETEIVDTGVIVVTPQNIAQYVEELKELGIKTSF